MERRQGQRTAGIGGVEGDVVVGLASSADLMHDGDIEHPSAAKLSETAGTQALKARGLLAALRE